MYSPRSIASPRWCERRRPQSPGSTRRQLCRFRHESRDEGFPRHVEVVGSPLTTLVDELVAGRVELDERVSVPLLLRLRAVRQRAKSVADPLAGVAAPGVGQQELEGECETDRSLPDASREGAPEVGKRFERPVVFGINSIGLGADPVPQVAGVELLAARVQTTGIFPIPIP